MRFDVIYIYIYFKSCRVTETPPKLPDFSVALKPDEYNLPPIDLSWNEEADTEPFPISRSEENKRDGKLNSFQPDQLENERRPLAAVK
jgi:hypothetical protein